jgi:hypothetical protein
MRAPLVVGREFGRGMRDAGVILIGEPCLFRVCRRMPAQQVIEAAILHHHDHDVVDTTDLRFFCGGRRRGHNGD